MSKRLRVSNIPPSVTKDSLTLFFESEKRSGGGDINDVDYDESNHVAIITFEDDEVVEQVVNKSKTATFLLEKQMIQVAPHVNQNVSSDAIKKEDNLEENAKAIIVSGFDNKTTRETLQYYLEGKRGADADIISIRKSDDGNAFIVWFKTEEVLWILLNTMAVKQHLKHINAILQKSHTLAGNQLLVKKYEPLPKYKNKVYIKGVNPKTTIDSLWNFLAAKLLVEPTEVLFGEEDGSVLVTFQEDIDIANLREICKKRALEGSYLTVNEVTVTDTIMVKGFSESTTEDTLQFYFENKRRSGVEGVKNVQMMKNDGLCFISFSDPYDVDIVCSRTHTVEGSTLQLQIHYNCLGNPLTKAQSLQFETPPPFVLEKEEDLKWSFIVKQNNQQILERRLQGSYGKIIWPIPPSEKLEIECTLDESVEDCRKLAKDWSRTIDRTLQSYLETIVSHEIKTNRDTLAEVEVEIKKMNEANTLITINNEENSIVVVGTSADTQQVTEKINDILKEAEKDIDDRKSRVTETLKLKRYETVLLSAINFQNQFKQERDLVVVEIDVVNNCMVFNGKATHMANSKMRVIDKVREIEQKIIEDVHEGILEFLRETEVKSSVERAIFDRGVSATWSIKDDNKVIMYAFSDEDLLQAIQTFHESVSSTFIPVTKAQTRALKTQAWERLVQNEQDKDTAKTIRIKVCEEQVEIYYTPNINIGSMRKIIEDFIYNNEEKQQQINLPIAHKRFIQEQFKNELQKLEHDLHEQGLRIDINDYGILLTGTDSALQNARQKIDLLRKDIVCKTHVIEKAGIVQHLENPETKAKVTQVERQCDVVIIIGEESDVCKTGEENSGQIGTAHCTTPTGQEIPTILSDITDLQADELVNAANEKSNRCSGLASPIVNKDVSEQIGTTHCMTPTGQKITTILGDITDLKADVLVNAANGTLNHCGGLAAAIVKKGGQRIQRECSDYIERRGRDNPLLEGDVVCSGAGDLSFGMIAHVVSCPYENSDHNKSRILSKGIRGALNETASKRYKSIAISAVGTGVYEFPIESACPVIIETIKDYFKANKTTSIQQVYLCDIHEPTVKQFEIALMKKFNKSNVSELEHEKMPPRRNRQRSKQDAAVTWSDTKPPSGQIRIALIPGILAKQEVDVIVNSTSKDLQLTHGAVSTSLLAAGGETLQTECTQNYPKGISAGDIAITNGGKLRCRKVFHGALNQWSDNAPKEMEIFMANCLETASKSGFQCIAFPALGTGKLGYPKEEVAKRMFSCVEKFDRMNQRSSLKDVRFVIYEKDSTALQAFRNEEKQWKLRIQSQFRYQSADHQTEVSMEFDHATFKVYKDDICKANVDVIFNCTDVNFTLKEGSTSAAICHRGGDNLTREIKIHGKAIKKDKIIITTADKNFGCELIIHLDMEDNRSDLKGKIKLVIAKMEEIEQKSVAFPIEDMGDTSVIGSSFVEVLQKYSGKDITVNCVSKDSVRLAELEDKLKSHISKEPSVASRFVGWVGLGGKQRRKPQLLISNFRNLSKQILRVYGKSEDKIKIAINTLEMSLATAFKTEFVEDMKIKTLPGKYIDELEQELMKFPVEFEINKKYGTIRLSGLHENILPTINAIHAHLRHAEDMMHSQEHASLLSEMVQWVFISVEKDGEELVDYPTEINVLIEMAFRENQTQAGFRDKDGNNYIVDFNSYTEYPEENPTDFVKVIRKYKVKASDFELPFTWSSMRKDENIKLVSLKPTDPEYLMVSKEFCKTVPNTIKKIEKVQNKALYQQYVAKKQSMGSGKNVERTLWHGTKYEALASINTYGFNRSYCGQNAVLYGNGVYFARDASYSARPTYTPKDHNNQKHMYMCKVLTGEFTKGKEGLKVPPTKPGEGHLLYDSVVNDETSPGIFVIFNDTQAYPEYLVLFE